MSIELRSEQTITVGVVGDTHVPDRVNRLHPELITALRECKVDTIFHTGDISNPRILDELQRVAPVYAVSGNRDILSRRTLLCTRFFLINGVKTVLTHGHINTFHYFHDKVDNFLNGYNVERYLRRLIPVAPEAEVYVFGHSHHAESRVIAGKLYFNPGSSSIAEKPDFKLSFGIIRFCPAGTVSGEIIELKGAVVRLGKWVPGE